MMQLDLAIIGGGVAGLHCAYRMRHAAPHLKLAVYERAAAIGGRMVSVAPEGARPLDGGASFVSSAHVRMHGLARDIGCPLSPVRFRQIGARLGIGMSITQGAQYPDRGAWPAPAAGFCASNLLRSTLTNLAPSAGEALRAGDFAAARQLLRECEHEGRPLWQWPIGPLLESVSSPQEVVRARFTHGCVSAFGSANAFDTLLTAAWESAPGQDFFRFEHGAGAFCAKLAKAADVATFTHHQLAAIERSDGAFVLRFITPAGPRRVVAKAVILALPRSALRAIAFGPAVVAPSFGDDLAAIGDVPAFKLFAAFDQPWWRDHGVALDDGEIGAVYTSLGAQQNYFERTHERHWMLAVFADGDNANAWRALIDAQAPAMGAAPAQLLAAAHRHLLAIYGAVPAPQRGVYAAWSAGWHSWRAGARSWEARARLAQPNKDLPLFICGEVLAEHAGWSESTLDNAEASLERALACMASLTPSVFPARI